jgi:TusA-related sulfurtransferase
MASLDHDEKTMNVDFRLDITGETCPLTFVRTKLLLERMQSGQVAEIRLQGAEPLDNVPKSVRDHGHTVLSLAPESVGSAVHLLRVRRG